MNYTGKNDEFIKTVNAISDKKYIGIYIQTNYDTYKFCIENHRICCEIFGVELLNHNNEAVFYIDCYEECPSQKNYELLKGYILKKISYCHNRYKPHKYDELYEQLIKQFILSLKITLNDKESKELIYYIDIYINLNGYYPHNYVIEWKQQKTFKEL